MQGGCALASSHPVQGSGGMPSAGGVPRGAHSGSVATTVVPIAAPSGAASAPPTSLFQPAPRARCSGGGVSPLQVE